MAGLSLYSLSKNRAYELMTSLLQHLLLALLPAEARQQLIAFPTALVTMIIVSIIALLLYFYAKGQEKHMDGVYVMSWLMHLPSILWYSNLDWLKVLGLPLNFQVLETRLSFAETLIISAILVGGRALLFFTSNIRDALTRLQGRGAEEDDLKVAAAGMVTLALALVALSTAMVLTMSYLIPMIKVLLGPVIALIPYPYVVIGAACLIIIPVIVIAYLYNSKT